METLKQTIARYKAIISDKTLLTQEIKTELHALKAEYADARRTRIEGPIDVLSEVDLIPQEDVVVTLTRKGYIKRVPVTTYGLRKIDPGR